VLKEFSQFPKYTWLVDAWLGTSSLCDILVSAAIVRSLWRSRTGISRTNDIIARLIIWTVNTGILTSVCAILDMVVFSAFPRTLLHLFFNILLGKLYANSVLATLNNRRSAEVDSSHSEAYSLSTVSGGRPHVAKQGDTRISGVHIMTQTIQDATANTQGQYSHSPELALSRVDNKILDWADLENPMETKYS